MDLIFNKKNFNIDTVNAGLKDFCSANNIDNENNRLNVLIDLFGQETPVEVELFQVTKID